MKSAKSISRFVIEYMAGCAVPYAVKLDGVQVEFPFNTIEDAVAYIHEIVKGIGIAEVMMCGITSIPADSGFEDVLIVKNPMNSVNLNVHIKDDQMHFDYKGMPLVKKISKISESIDFLKKFSPKIKEIGGEISIRVECGPVRTKSMTFAEFENFAEYLVK